MLQEYIAAAMDHARYEILPDDRSFYGEILACPGAYANEATLEKCRKELQAVLEDWILFRIHQQLPLPEIDGIRLEVRKLEAA